MYASRRSIVLGLALILFLCAVPAFPQAGVTSIDPANELGEQTMRMMSERQIFAVPTLPIFRSFGDQAARSVEETPGDSSSSPPGRLQLAPEESRSTVGNALEEEAKNSPPVEKVQSPKPTDFNRDIYYRNKLEFSLNAGWLPINIPFPLDVFVGDTYDTYPLKYTLVPIFASLRWQVDSVKGPWVLRGNWDMTFTGSVTAIPRGPESRYFSYLMGIRRNFVPRRGKIAPYFDIRLGVGNIDAKGPDGVKYAQGQDLTFTVNMGSGVRYNLSPRYAISAGLNFMHISNLDLSEHAYTPTYPQWGYQNFGINVYGPMVGLEVQLRRHGGRSGE